MKTFANICVLFLFFMVPQLAEAKPPHEELIADFKEMPEGKNTHQLMRLFENSLPLNSRQIAAIDQYEPGKNENYFPIGKYEKGKYATLLWAKVQFKEDGKKVRYFYVYCQTINKKNGEITSRVANILIGGDINSTRYSDSFAFNRRNKKMLRVETHKLDLETEKEEAIVKIYKLGKKIKLHKTF